MENIVLHEFEESEWLAMRETPRFLELSETAKMDFNPIRHRDRIDTSVAFFDPDDPAYAEIERNYCYFVKGDGDQDRAN